MLRKSTYRRVLFGLVGSLAFTAAMLGATPARAAIGDTLFSDDFESGFGQWTTTDTNLSGINTATSSSASNSLYVRGDTVQTTSSVIDTRVPGVRIQAWIRRGDDAFSEGTDVDEDLLIEYLDSAGNWITITHQAGGRDEWRDHHAQ